MFPTHLKAVLTGPLCPLSNHGSPVTLLKFQMAPKLMLLISSGSRKKEPIYTCLGDRGSTVVKVLCYKSVGRWFDPSWCHWNFSLT